MPYTLIKNFAELLIIIFITTIIVYTPELFPRCAFCGHTKARWAFSLHTHTSLSLSRTGNKSVCKKCCFNENITTISDLDKKKEIKSRVKYKTKYTLR